MQLLRSGVNRAAIGRETLGAGEEGFSGYATVVDVFSLVVRGKLYDASQGEPRLANLSWQPLQLVPLTAELGVLG